jgi:PadR family transcriptional regulator PadR
MAQDTLGPLEFQLIALLQEHPNDAYGISIMQGVEDRTHRKRSLAAIYAALDRLQEKGMISSWWGEPTQKRGGRRKRYYKIEASGIEAVQRTRLAVQPSAPRANSEEDEMRKILAVAERMKTDLVTAIAAEQVFRPAASDNQLIGCFNVGYAADAFNLVRHSLLFQQAMALMRLWDDTGKDVHSILTLEDLLSVAGLVAKLVERDRQATHDIRRVDTTFGETEEVLPFSAARSTPDQRECESRTRVSSWLTNVSKAKGYAEIARIRKYRHEILAHSPVYRVVRGCHCPPTATSKKRLKGRSQ